MKNTITVVFLAFALFGCGNQKVQVKAVLDSILTVHDKVMGVDGKLMDNKLKLDTLLKLKAAAGKDSVKMLITKLAAADSAMDIWMNNFKAEYKGKTDEETATYMKDQKKLIMAIDSQVSAAVAESNKYLKKIK
jgi:hypothetical protein